VNLLDYDSKTNLPDFGAAAGVNAKQKAADDARFKRADNDDVSTCRQRPANEDAAAVAEDGRRHDRHYHVYAILAVIFHLLSTYQHSKCSDGQNLNYRLTGSRMMPPPGLV